MFPWGRNFWHSNEWADTVLDLVARPRPFHFEPIVGTEALAHDGRVHERWLRSQSQVDAVAGPLARGEAHPGVEVERVAVGVAHLGHEVLVAEDRDFDERRFEERP